MDKATAPGFRCVLHGSFQRYFAEIRRAHRLFAAAGIEVLAPADAEMQTSPDGFARLATEEPHDARHIELLYLHHLRRLGENGFSYFVNPDGYIGRSAAYELGIAQTTNVRCFFSNEPKDLPVYVQQNSVWSPDLLVEYISARRQLPPPRVRPKERVIQKLWEDLMVPGSVVAVGGIIEYAADSRSREREVLLVKTHKWGGRYSIVGGKVRRYERLDHALRREVKEETGLDAAVDEHLCTFDQIKGSGYYLSGIQHIFVDKVARVTSRRVRLNDEAEEYLWLPPKIALRDLPLEPNARHTLEKYFQTLKVS